MLPIYVPATSPDSWRQFLKDPEKHWKTGYSARTLAHSWHDADGMPSEIATMLATSDGNALTQLQPLLVAPEWKTPIAGKGEPPHSDVFVLAKALDNQLVTMTIEGKVDESFGTNNQAVRDWKLAGNDDNRRIRLDFLLDKLSLAEHLADDLAYQLIQRTASAVVEAERFNAKYAIMIVHSFSPTHSNWRVFHGFAQAFGKDIKVGELVEISRYKDIPIYIGWAQGDPRYLRM